MRLAAAIAFLFFIGGTSALAQPAWWVEVPGAAGDTNNAIHLIDFSDAATPGSVGAVQNLQLWYDSDRSYGYYATQVDTFSGSAPWISLTNNADGTISVQVNSLGMGSGSYLGYLAVADYYDSSIPWTVIAVRMTIAPKPGAPDLYATDVASISAAVPKGSTTKIQRSFALNYTDGKNSTMQTAGQALVLDEPWLGFWVTCKAHLNPVGVAPNQVDCIIDPTGIPPGRYFAYATFNDSANTTAVTREISLSVTDGLPDTQQLYTLNYTAGIAPGNLSIQPGNEGKVSYSYSATTDVDWLSIGGAIGRTPTGLLTVAPNASRIVPVQPGQLPVTLTGHVTIKATDTSGISKTLNVKLVVNPSPVAQPSQLFPSAANLVIASSSPAQTTLSVTSTTPGRELQFSAQPQLLSGKTVNWLTLSTNSTTTPASIRISASMAGLAPGNYFASILLSSGPGVRPVLVPLVFRVSNPTLNGIVSLVTFDIGGLTGGLKVLPGGMSFSTDPNLNLLDPQAIQFTNVAQPFYVSLELLTFGADPSATNYSWLSLSKTLPSTADLTQVSLANISTLASGRYFGYIKVLSTDGSNNLLDYCVVTLDIP